MKRACRKCGSLNTHRCRRVRDAICVHCDDCGNVAPHPHTVDLRAALPAPARKAA